MVKGLFSYRRPKKYNWGVPRIQARLGRNSETKPAEKFEIKVYYGTVKMLIATNDSF